MQPVAERTLRVGVAHSRAQIAQLEARWTQLHQRESRATAWTEPHLLIAFDRMFYPAHRPRVLVARERDGTVRGILPLSMEMHRVGPVFLRRIVPMAGSQSCYPDAVIEPGHEQSVMPALARALDRLHWDELRLRWVDPDAHLLHPEHGVARGSPTVQAAPGDAIWRIPLQDVQDLLRRRPRQEMARRLRRLSERGAVVLGWEPRERLSPAMREFIALHTRLKDHQKQLAFYRLGTAAADTPEWLVHEQAAGRADLFTIRCDGTLLAGKIILRSHGEAVSFRTAWDPAFATYGLGVLLGAHAMEACRDRGDRQFDMGPGAESYKSEWAPMGGQTSTLTAIRDTWRSRVAARWLVLRGRHRR